MRREALIRRRHLAATTHRRGATGETGPWAGLRAFWGEPAAGESFRPTKRAAYGESRAVPLGDSQDLRMSIRTVIQPRPFVAGRLAVAMGIGIGIGRPEGGCP